MIEFKCRKGHITEVPDVEVSEEALTIKSLHSDEMLVAQATHDMGIDRDDLGREYVTCGWIREDDEETPDTIGGPQALAISLEGEAVQNNVEEWYCTERAYRV